MNSSFLINLDSLPGAPFNRWCNASGNADRLEYDSFGRLEKPKHDIGGYCGYH